MSIHSRTICNLLALFVAMNLVPACRDKSKGSSPPLIVEAPAERKLTNARLNAMQGRHTKEELVDCIGHFSPTEECQLAELEIESSPVTVDDILARTLVESEGMGIRYRRVLETIPANFLQLAGCTTGTVIASDVRTQLLFNTGATVIRLEAQENPEAQAETAWESPLPYGLVVQLTRLGHDFDDAPPDRGEWERENFAATLIHEWSHACDILSFKRNNKWLSKDIPLPASERLGKYAQFLFRSAQEFKEEVGGYDPLALADEFSQGTAPSFYSYSSIAENFAEIVSNHYIQSVLKRRAVHAVIDFTTSIPGDWKSSRVLWSLYGHGCAPQVADATRAALSLLGRGMEQDLDRIISCNPQLGPTGVTWQELPKRQPARE